MPEQPSYSSSPKNTLIGIHESLTTLNLVFIPLSASMWLSDSAQPSKSKLLSILDGVTLLGMTLVPRWMLHINLDRS
jgi:hypothetical protein